MNAISFDVTERRGGPALLLVHALGANRTMWHECATIWARVWTVIACDLRGAGESPAPDRPWAPEDHARDLEQVRVEAGVGKVIPIGCAIGALVAATYAQRHQENVSALILSEPTLRIDESSRAMIMEWELWFQR